MPKRPVFSYLDDHGDDFFSVESPPREAIAEGACYVQDPSTAIAPELLAPSPSDSVLDLCAAPGGKTALLAQMMRNDGRIIPTNSSGKRLERMMGNLSRLGVNNVTCLTHDWIENPKGPVENKKFDRILLDVPCSNTGVIRRRVDVRWRLRESDFAEMAATQFQLLMNSVAVLKPGRALVYSTCSLDSRERASRAEGARRRATAQARRNEAVSAASRWPGWRVCRTLGVVGVTPVFCLNSGPCSSLRDRFLRAHHERKKPGPKAGLYQLPPRTGGSAEGSHANAV